MIRRTRLLSTLLVAVLASACGDRNVGARGDDPAFDLEATRTLITPDQAGHENTEAAHLVR